MVCFFCHPLGTKFIVAVLFWNIVIHVFLYLREGWSKMFALYSVLKLSFTVILSLMGTTLIFVSDFVNVCLSDRLMIRDR